MAGFRKHRRPPRVTAHVCHRLHLPSTAGGGRPLSAALGAGAPAVPAASDPLDPRATFWSVKRRPLPPAKIHASSPPISLDRAIEEVRKAGAWPENDADRYRQQVDLLERRLAKVNGLLENNELEIRRLRRMKTVETGVASKFTEVQGIAEDDEQGEAKKEMMSQIFAANLKLHQRISSQSGSSD